MFELRSDLKAVFPGKEAFDRIMALEGKVYRNVAGRRTIRFEIDGRGYFLKVHPGVGWREVLKNLLMFRLPVLGAKNEWRAILRMQELGIETMRIAGFGERGISPTGKQSFLITDELVNTLSLEEFCGAWPQNPPPVRLKRMLIEKVASIASRLHNNGVNHRDFYICHFLLDLATVNSQHDPRIFLIDLHRVQIRLRTPRRWILKDLAGLYFSSMDIGLTARDRMRFVRAYRRDSLKKIVTTEKGFWDSVVRKASKLYRKHYSGT